MVRKIIDLGSPPYGKDGDTNRAAFIKTNENFEELFDREHNDHEGLQGGTEEEYFHLTQDEHGQVQGLKGASQLEVGTSANTVAAGDDNRIVNAVPKTRKVNGKTLNADISLTPADVGAVPSGRKVNGKTLDSDVSLSHSDVGAEPSFSKNSAFNKNFGASAGTVAAGDDPRILRGDEAHSWGDHGSAGYAQRSSLEDLSHVVDGKLDANALSSNLTYFMTNIQSEVEDYLKVVTDIHDPDFSEEVEVIESSSIGNTGDGANIANFLTTPGIKEMHLDNLSMTISGAVRLADGGTAKAAARFEVWVRQTDSTEYKIGESGWSSTIGLATFHDIHVTALIPHVEFELGDQLLIKYFVKKVGTGSNPKIRFRVGGDDPMRALLPMPVVAMLPDFHKVAVSGEYEDLKGKPELGSAAYLSTGTGSNQVSKGDHVHAVVTTSVNGFMSSGDKSKLDGVATGATKNYSDATLLSRANHTGTQPASTVTGLADVATSGKYSDLSGTPDQLTQAEVENAASTKFGVVSGQRLAQSAKKLVTQQTPSFFLQDSLRASVEASTGGRQTVLYTAKGQPCFMYVLPQFNVEDIHADYGTGIHPAFLYNGVRKETFIGVYQASIVDGEAVSQPGVIPAVSINYDNSLAACLASGTGFRRMSVWDWAAVAMQIEKQGFEPRGNSQYGRHHDNKEETGVRAGLRIPGDTDGDGKTKTGSGPNSWAHDHSPAGIADLVGNVWEWNTGMKLVDGRVWLAPDNGKLNEADWVDSGFDLVTSNPWRNTSNTGASASLKQAFVVPRTGQGLTGYGSSNVSGTRLPIRGGSWNNTADAGPGALHLSRERTNVNANVGFRLAFG